MKTPHPKAELLKAVADGEALQRLYKGRWIDVPAEGVLRYLADESDVSIRVKVDTININGFNVPRPLRELPAIGARYWVVQLSETQLTFSVNNSEDATDSSWIKKGICHLTRDSAIMHAKALLSFNSNENQA